MSVMAELLTVDYHSPLAGRDFTESLHQTGFAVIKNHPIAAQLVDDVYAEWQNFFKSADKMDYLFDKETQEGYFPFKSENAKYTSVKDLKEFYHLFCWSKMPQGISDKTRQLFNQMNNMAGVLLQWIEDNLPKEICHGLSIPLSEMIKDSPRTGLRVLHYPPLMGDEEVGAVRGADHEDISMLTLLPASTAKGLQVQDKHGQWYDVPCDYGTIVVNTGDTLTELTQGHLPATTHRVINPEGELAKQSRLSMPLFLHPRDEVLLSDGRTAKDFLYQRFRELGLF